ncbi:TetR-like C-terminal domain-containing protein [Paenibacillus ferrarius]|nr:TetR-like C-terminal domain-containing protein [Paenibacillus ferrarius]
MSKRQQSCSESEAVVQLLNLIYDRRSIYRIIIAEHKEGSFLTEILLEFKEQFFRHKEINDQLNESKRSFIFAYMVYGTTGVINQWLESGEETNPHVVAQVISSLTQNATRISEERSLKI